MSRLLALAILVLVCTVGCNRSNVTTGDLAGTWVMKEKARQILPPPIKGASAKIVLLSEGRFVASEMPGLLYGDSGGGPELDGGSGTWKLLSREGGQEIQLNFYKITAGSTQLPVPYGTQIMVSKPWSVVNMEYYIGDQDQGMRVEFEKK